MKGYRDAEGRVLIISCGLLRGTKWSTFHLKANGSLRRVCSPCLPWRADRADAERDLELYATAHRWREVT